MISLCAVLDAPKFACSRFLLGQAAKQWSQSASSNDAIHFDRQGAVAIPAEPKEIPATVDLLTRREKVIIDASEAAWLLVARLRQPFRAG